MWPIYFFDISNNNSAAHSNWFKDYGSIIGNFITIVLFVFAFYNEKRKERNKSKKTKTEKLKYLASLINSSIETAKAIRNNVDETSSEFKKEPAQFHLLKWKTYYDIKRIVEKLNLEEYYLAYISQFETRKDKITEYQKIITSLDTLFEMFNELIKQAERASVNDFERKKVVNVLGDEIDNTIGKVLNLIDVLQMPESFKMELKEPINKWSNEPNKENIQLFNDALCSPLYNTISKFKIENKQSQNQIPEEFDFLVDRLRKVKIEIDFVKTGNLKYAESLNNQIIEIDKTINTLEKNSKELREYLENTENENRIL